MTTPNEFLKAVDGLEARETVGDPPAEESTEKTKRFAGRECGECSMCCKVLPIKELDKPVGVWCRHCHPGRGGCSIYDKRPEVCREFACGWLTASWLGEEWKPSRSKIMLRSKAEANKRVDLYFIVDPATPGRWREAPYYAGIKRAAFDGLNLIGTEYRQTYVMTGKQTFLILPRKDLELTGDFHLVLNTGSAWDWTTAHFKTMAEADQFTDEMRTRGRVRGS